MKPEPEHPLAAPAPGLTHPWPEPPEGGTSILVAPGIRWIRMPLPFQLNHINLWLLDDEAGVTVVDTGIGLPPTRELWEKLFTGELAGRPLVRVLVTHFHPDHIGNADWLAQRFGVELWCPQAEWLMAQPGLAGDGRQRLGEAAQPLSPSRRPGRAGRGLSRAGQQLPEARAVGRARASGRCARATWSRSAGARWHAFTVMGHAPEHACLFSPEANVLISGDQVLPKITTNVSVWPDQPNGNPLKLYLDSLGRFRPLPEETLVLPSHGLPFIGLHKRLDYLQHHHDERLSETIDALAEPRTAHELVPVLFRRQLDAHQLGFAIGETVAHLHFLEARGQAPASSTATGVHRFRKA